MNKVVITGAFGFIGSNTVLALNKIGIIPYVIDNWKDNDPKWRNIVSLQFKRISESDLDDRALFPIYPIIVAIGARVDTKEGMSEALWEDNVKSVLRLHKKASKLIYASSGSVYGNSADLTERIDDLTPLCPYAITKAYLDSYFFGYGKKTCGVYGLRFTNVFGQRETHKGDMASLVTKGLLKQSPLYTPPREETGSITTAQGVITTFQHSPPQKAYWTLFKHESGKPILRDFIHVSDIASIVLHFIESKSIPAGVYNCGSGVARPFEDLVKLIEDLPIEYTPIPPSLIKQYQRHTKADITKLREVAGYSKPFLTLEEGIEQTREWLKHNPI